jgi:predicted DCC family thiol-disulfide oxidoreductase YuxK
MAERDHLIFFDQDCGFCLRTLRIVYRRDQRVHRRLFPIALQDRATLRELADLSEGERMESWHLKTPSGDVLSGGAAIAPLIALLELPRPLAALARKNPEMADRGYRWVAARRSVFGWLTRWLPRFDQR